MNNNQHDYDPGLVKLIQLLRETPERDAQIVESRKQRFLNELDELFSEQSPQQVSALRRLFPPRRSPSRQGLRPRLAFSALLAVLLLAVFLFGGAGVTVYAAQSALPGDSLYAVKTRLERTRLSLSANDFQVASIQLSLANVRLDEIEGLIREQRYRQVSETTRQFESHLSAAIEAMRRLAEKDPERASQIANQITLVLNRYTQVLSRMLADLPLEVKTEVEDTISKSPVLRKASGSNENENEHENEAQQENENAASNDNQNDNDNANENEARNENRNENGRSQDDSRQLRDFTFVGFVERISAREWQISGIRIAVISTTKIDANIKVGDRVEVKGQYISGQTAQASEIRLRKTDRQENTNDRQTNGNENDNGANENQRQNEDSSGNQNENSDQNQNDNDNHNDNGNDNDDDDDKDDNSNDNDNDNDND